MRKLFVLGVMALSLAYAGSAIASDGAAIFKSKCLACHGPDGKGTAMAPAFQGNDYIKSSDDAEIAKTIKDGRSGAAKKYKNFALSMPAQKGNMSDADISAVIEYLKSVAGH
jgi:cbb3-type cytochrome c oxidase subunit III